MAPILSRLSSGAGGGFGFSKKSQGAGGGVVSNIIASGGIIHEWTEPGPGTKYRAHIFINPGSFDVSSIPGSHPGTMDYLVVGGGGGGAGDNGGGGGGGGVYTGSTSIAALSYTIKTGIGGKGTWNSSVDTPGYDGGPSYFIDPSGPTTRTAGGGGGGGAFPSGNGRSGLTPGGSGGGGGYGTSGGTGNTDSGAQNGGNGGPGAPAAEGGGGGGGAGGTAGQSATASGETGSGGAGYPSTILGVFLPAPNSVWGGGGAGMRHPGADPGIVGSGGAGGGGGGSGTPQPPASQGTGGVGLNQGYFGRRDPGGFPQNNSGGPAGMFTGGGGGDGGATRSAGGVPAMVGPRNYDPTRDWHTAGGDGGPGICVFRYELDAATDLNYTKATGGFVHKDSNGDVYHVFIGPTYHGNPGPAFPTGADFATGGTPFPATVLLVGGGGGAGCADAPNKYSGGGGGAGGIIVNPGYTFTSSTTCKVLVGQGGEGGGFAPPSFPTWGCRAAKGDRTALLNPAGPFTHEVGGGGGGGHDSGPGGQPGEPSTNSSGGGGGGAYSAGPNPHYTAFPQQGDAGTGTITAPTDGTGTWTGYANPGGTAYQSPPYQPAGGGGGSGGAGNNGGTRGGAGGAAQGFPQFPDFLGVGTPGPTPGIAYFGGGGGGGSSNVPAGEAGGEGGGAGAGGNHPSTGGTSEPVRVLLTALTGTGSGGGGGGTGSHTLGGPGGPGVVIIKYSA